MISIIDYEMGNIGSIVNMFKYLNIEAKVIRTVEEILKADKLLLPGVGAFDAAMRKLNTDHLGDAIKQKAEENTPILGICLGMQLLTNSSDEGNLTGLGLIDAETISFKKREDKTLKVPHMGWNVVIPQASSSMLEGFDEWDELRFYFVHSYYIKCKSSDNSLMTTKYGLEFDSMIYNNNIFGAQFHPEKSHKFGMKLFENFARL